jgi:hypothetical protein
MKELASQKVQNYISIYNISITELFGSFNEGVEF